MTAHSARPTYSTTASARLEAGLSLALLSAACSSDAGPVDPGPTVTKRIVFTTDRTGDWDVWSMNEDGTGRKNLSQHPAQEHFPAWSPDGSRIAFTSTRDRVSPQDGNTGLVNLTNHPVRDDYAN